MRQFFAKLLSRLAKSLEKEKQELINQSEVKESLKTIPESQVILLTPTEKIKRDQTPDNKIIGQKEKKPQKKISTSTEAIEFDPRDMMEIMEVPFLALSKDRKNPIVYQSHDGKVKVRISAHPPHFMASVYDWDIVLFVASKMQEIINSFKDIPPRTIVIPRRELLKALHKHDGKKEEKDLRASLSRLKLTGIETTIRNEDGRYDAGFGFLDSWGYTDRTDLKEIRITLSQWLYDGICKKGSLLKVSQEYFNLTSGLKKFLYRTARKHVGHRDLWEFSIEKLYEKSGSEREFKKFKHDLKKIVFDNDLPDYFLEWKEKDGKTLILFKNKTQKLIENSSQNSSQ